MTVVSGGIVPHLAWTAPMRHRLGEESKMISQRFSNHLIAEGIWVNSIRKIKVSKATQTKRKGQHW